MTDTRPLRWLEGSAPPARLGVLRAAIGGYALWYVGTRSELISDLARRDVSLYDPVGPFRALAAPLDPALADWMVVATVVTGVAFVAGALYRLSGPLFALLLLLTLSYRNSWSMVFHMHNALVVHVLILGMVHAADGFSVDSLIRRRREPSSARYQWPIALICAVTAAGYLVAGVAKLCGPTGMAWASGELLREQIATDAIRKHVLDGDVVPVARALYDHVWLFTVIGVATLVLEVGAPLFLANARLRRLWAVSAWLMHWGVLVIMGIKFRYHLSFVMFLPFFRVERVLSLFTGLGRWVRSAR